MNNLLILYMSRGFYNIFVNRGGKKSNTVFCQQIIIIFWKVSQVTVFCQQINLYLESNLSLFCRQTHFFINFFADKRQ